MSPDEHLMNTLPPASSQAEVARLQHALDAESATHEAATHELRRELQHAHDSAVERTRTLEATIAELKAAHAAALAKVRSAHEASVKAERDARAEAERQSSSNLGSDSCSGSCSASAATLSFRSPSPFP